MFYYFPLLARGVYTACGMNIVKVKLVLRRKLPADVSAVDMASAQLQSDLKTAQIKIDELEKEVRL